MALSIANVIAWDFTRATTPLVSQIGQSETVTLVGAGVTRDNTDGIIINGGSSYASLPCTNGGNLTNWTRPHSFVMVVYGDRTGTSSASYAAHPMWMRYASDATTPKTGMVNWGAGAGSLAFRNNTFNQSVVGALPNLTWSVVVVEFNATGVLCWVNNVAVSLGTGAPAALTFLTTDLIRFGAQDLNNPKMRCRGFAIVPGALTAGDRAALQTDWRAALFNPTSVGVVSASLHLTHGMR